MSVVSTMFGPQSTVRADDLILGGFTDSSDDDWPGRTVSTVYLQGCPWSCGYCNGAQLRDPLTPGSFAWGMVRKRLQAAGDSITGLVFSGGEPTRQSGLTPAMEEVRAMGLGVGLHSSGAYPGRLRHALEHTDWLGLDIKAPQEGYAGVTGHDSSGLKAWTSLEIAIDWGGDFDVRLTVDPTVHTENDVAAVIDRVKALGGPEPVIQDVNPEGTSPEYQARWNATRSQPQDRE